MAGLNTDTYTTAADTNAATYAMPTNRDGYYMFKSHKTNTGIFWVSERNNTDGTPVTAVAEADDMMIVEPGESILLRRPGDSISVICTVITQKFTVSNSAARVR